MSESKKVQGSLTSHAVLPAWCSCKCPIASQMSASIYI